jgi:hypothetical protein
MTYTPDPTKGIKVYVDADFAGGWDPGDAMNADNVYSRTGYVIRYAGCPIYWQSKLQTEIALSTAESEYIALSQALRETLPMTGLMKEINVIFPLSCHHQCLLSRSEKTISHALALRWHRIPSSLLEQNTLRSSIITFASMLSLSQIQLDFLILIIAQQMIR